jgi:hypothetical protein
MECAGVKWPAVAIYAFGLNLSIGIIEKAAELAAPDGLVRRIRVAFLGSHR